MKVRVLSDLHLDVNSSHYIELKDKDVFTVVCGDTAGDPFVTKKWISKNVHRGLFIAGNHLVYNYRNKDISELREEMADGFGIDDPVTYLDCLQKSKVFYKKVEDVHFIGTTLYTDFYYCNPHDSYHFEYDRDLRKIRNKRASHSRMNDYRWGLVKNERGDLRKLVPDDYEEYFAESFSMVRKLVEQIEKEEPSAKIFMLTHHCPSPKCIDNNYADSDVNSTYVSDLEDFIVSHPVIKCWACGHVHNCGVFQVGDCKIVMNPRGYCQWCEDLRFSKDLTVDTDTWEVEIPELTAAQKAKNDKRLRELMRMGAWLM